MTLQRPANGRRLGGPSGASGAPGGGRGFFGGGPGIPGATSSKAQAAFNACRSKLPNGGFGGFGGRGGNPAALQAYLSCLGDHGVTVPKRTSTSTPASRPGGFASPLAAVRSNPKFAAADKICRPLLPARGNTSTTTAP